MSCCFLCKFKNVEPDQEPCNDCMYNEGDEDNFEEGEDSE